VPDAARTLSVARHTKQLRPGQCALDGNERDHRVTCGAIGAALNELEQERPCFWRSDHAKIRRRGLRRRNRTDVGAQASDLAADHRGDDARRAANACRHGVAVPHGYPVAIRHVMVVTHQAGQVGASVAADLAAAREGELHAAVSVCDARVEALRDGGGGGERQ
jgi:hypothetical protein